MMNQNWNQRYQIARHPDLNRPERTTLAFVQASNLRRQRQKFTRLQQRLKFGRRETHGNNGKGIENFLHPHEKLCASTSIYSFDWAIFITWTGYDQDFFHLASLKLFVGLALEILKCKQSSLKPKPRCLQCCFRSKPTSGIPAKVWCEWIRPTKMHLYNPVAIAPLTAICRGARFFSKKSCCQLLSQDYQWHKPRVFHIILMPSTTGSDILLRGYLLWNWTHPLKNCFVWTSRM